MRLFSSLALALTLVAGLTGCRSAVITDVYVSRDADAVRRTDCIHTESRAFYVYAEITSYRDDTIVWPLLTVLSGNDEPDTTIPFLIAGDGQPIYSEDTDIGKELNEFGNMAPGKGEGTKLEIALERDLESEPPAPRFSRGSYRYDFYLNDESTPRESLRWKIDGDPICDFSPIPNTQ
jgi:hypothetical protein